MRWVDGKRQEALAERYSGDELEAKLSEVIKKNSKGDTFFRRVPLPSIGTSRCSSS